MLGRMLKRLSEIRSRSTRPEAGSARKSAEIVAMPPRVLAELSDAAYAELAAMAKSDGVSPSQAASRILEECLTDDPGEPPLFDGGQAA